VEGDWLLISDTTEAHFSGANIKGLGPVGDGSGSGFLLHSSLMVRTDGSEIAGLAGQVIRYRKAVPKEICGAQRLRREDRESVIWWKLIDGIGKPPQGVRFTHVFDRGGDQFELYCHISQTGAGWVGRASQLSRTIGTPEDQKMKLVDYLEQLPVVGTYTLDIPATKKTPARQATMEVRCGALVVPRPRNVSAWVRKNGIKEINMWVVEAREINAPKNIEPTHWVLLTSDAVENFADAWRILGYYEKRWLVEEFHKALKTGCRLESRQYETAKRLEAISGMLSVLAVRLLQLKIVARNEPDRSAEDVVPKSWVVMLQAMRKRKVTAHWSVGKFYRELAMLGGFLGRKSDGQPGWMTLWRGFEKMNLCLRGADAYRRRCG